MNHFAPCQRDVRENQIYREVLLAQPAEFFRDYFGIVPDLTERLRFVEKLIHTMAAPQTYANDIYTVRMREMAPFVQLDIVRRDGQPCTNWREFQQIKNELIGPECEAVELFPAESRLVDTANQYHLWANPSRNFRFPFGYQRRVVIEKPVVYRGRSGTEEAIPLSLPLNGDNAASHAC